VSEATNLKTSHKAWFCRGTGVNLGKRT